MEVLLIFPRPSYTPPVDRIPDHDRNSFLYTYRKKWIYIMYDFVVVGADFNIYQHRVLTTTSGKIYSIPINLATIN